MDHKLLIMGKPKGIVYMINVGLAWWEKTKRWELHD